VVNWLWTAHILPKFPRPSKNSFTVKRTAWQCLGMKNAVMTVFGQRNPRKFSVKRTHIALGLTHTHLLHCRPQFSRWYQLRQFKRGDWRSKLSWEDNSLILAIHIRARTEDCLWWTATCGCPRCNVHEQ
jgi:hypothetical protein